MAVQPSRYEVLGMGVDALTRASAIDSFSQMVEQHDRGYVVFCTVSTVLTARDDPDELQAVNSARLITPDGMPLVWLGRRAGHEIERVYGPDFMIDLMEATGGELSHYFFGGAPGAANEMAAKLAGRFPALRVAGTFSPPMGLSATEIDEEVIAAINLAGPDIVWVGLGHPKQDIWMHTYRPHLRAPVLAGVGAAFDFHSGRKKEAPEWMKRSGLQWLHRLADEPGRLWKRYLVGNTRFLWLLARERFRRSRSEP